MGDELQIEDLRRGTGSHVGQFSGRHPEERN